MSLVSCISDIVVTDMRDNLLFHVADLISAVDFAEIEVSHLRGIDES